MALQARNDAQLKSMLVPKLGIVVDYVVQKIWNDNRELVRRLVYEAYDPVDYNRTGEFKEAWDTTYEYNVSSGHAKGQFYYDPSKLTPGDNDPDSSRYGQHVSAIDRVLMTDYLAEVIYQGLAGPAFGHGVQDGAWARKRDVWETLMKNIGERKMKQWIKEGFDKAGIAVQSHGTALGVTYL